MKREKYKQELINRCGGMIEQDGKYYISGDNAEAMIDMLFDDIESRICENCEFYDKELKACKNDDSIAFTSRAAIYPDDGCNKWEMRK